MISSKYHSKKLVFLMFILIIGVFISDSMIATAQSSPYIDLTINEEKFLPGQTLICRVYLFNLPKEGIELKILDSNKNLVLERDLIPETNFEYTFETNASAGYWEIVASYGDISAKRTIKIEEKEGIDTNLVDDSLVITNIGNIPYKKTIIIIFTNEEGKQDIKRRDLTLDLNQEVEFKLRAKDGIYDIIVDGKVFRDIPLTGKVTSLIELDRKPGIFSQYPVLAFLLFAFLILLVVILTINIKGKPFRLYERNDRYIEIKKREEFTPMTERETAKVKQEKFSVYPSKKVEYTAVLHGEKQGTTIVVINVKNLPELKNRLETAAFDSLTNFLKKQTNAEIEDNRGSTRTINEAAMMGIFSAATRQFRHEMAAVKTALKIRDALESYNRRLKDKIEYGIGVNTGELIISIDNVMRYTSIGNTISLAKKLAEMSKNDIYAASDTYSRVVPDVQGNKIGKVSTINGNIDIYSIKNIGSREVYKSYLNDILKRIDKR